MAKGRRMPGIPGMPGNVNNMMKQVQKMQKQMEDLQAEIEAREIEASSGGGAVTVKVNGKREMIAIQIEPEVIDADDIEMLQDLILAATNEALRKAEDMMSAEMGKITGGMNIPGLF